MARLGLGTVLAAALAAAVAGCGGATSAAEVAPDFEEDARRILNGVVEDAGRPGAEAKVTADGSSPVECDGGGERLRFAASFPIEGNGETDSLLDDAENAALVWLEDAGYQIEDYRPSDDPQLRELTATNDDGTVSFTVRLEGEPAMQFHLRGRTTCVTG